MNIYPQNQKSNLNGDENRRYLLALFHIPGVGLRTLQNIRKFFKEPKELFLTKKNILEKMNLPSALLQGLCNPPWQAVEKDFIWLNKNSTHHIITLDDTTYPKILAEIPDAPMILYLRGNIEILHKPKLAMVGSRNPSYSGIETAQNFAAELVMQGLTITSGLALGIDTACHIGALTKPASTIAVLGTGVDIIYPKNNTKLANDIIERGGALISELPLGENAKAKNFPLRNRIISGLSLGTLVLEATEKSGSLITAHFAVTQNREVFAIPGSIHNPLARGCHKILREGAKLVETVNDVLEELYLLCPPLKKITEPPFKNNNPKKNKNFLKQNNLDSDEQKLLECIGYDSTSVDTLIERSNFSAAKVTTLLLMLECKKLIIGTPGGYIKSDL